jgi:two-component system copper resistance phosphate regulon response regulator CusR
VCWRRANIFYMRILVVEDEEKIALFVKAILEADCFAVDVAYDGEKGLSHASINDYDLVILDNILPKKKGIEVCKELRKNGKQMPIIILSVKNEAVEKIDLLNAGADDYLTKPFVVEELLARVHALLRRRVPITQEVLRLGELVLNSKNFTVVRGGRSIRLTRKEFMLLQYLMQNADTVLSRGMILEHVWDMSVDIFSNTIESHILSLRKKLGEGQKNKMIYTISGRGYKITSA